MKIPDRNRPAFERSCSHSPSPASEPGPSDPLGLGRRKTERQAELAVATPQLPFSKPGRSLDRPAGSPWGLVPRRQTCAARCRDFPTRCRLFPLFTVAPSLFSFAAESARNTRATTQSGRPKNESMGFDAISHSLSRNQINSGPNWVPCHRCRLFPSLAWGDDDTGNDPGASG